MNRTFAHARSQEIAGRVIAGKYVLHRALAAGGMGSVWAAWNTQLDVPVAIKFMAPGLVDSAELVARFEREARAAAQIRSAQVVQIFEHGVEDGQPFIVMELLEGEDLGQRMRRLGRLSLGETARVVHQVCRALRRAHALGIIHRDLKPANIFLARLDEDEDDAVKVLDFGVVKSIAEAVASGVTKTGELIGTPHYMSPEQARSVKSVDHRSDLWSLAVIAYRAITASLPFPDDEGIEMLLRVCSEHAPPPSSFAPDLAPDVDAFFDKALAIDPSDRFQSAREMAEAMAQVAGVPLSARSGPPSSLPDDSPSSMRSYPSHAYVYTSASTGQSTRIARPAAHGGRSIDAQPTALDTRCSPGIEPEIVERAPLSPMLADMPTRISGALASGPGRRPASYRPAPVAVVTASGTEDTAPGPLAPIIDEESTMSRVGLERPTASRSSRNLSARPRIQIAAAGALLLFAFAILLSPFDRTRVGAPPPAPTHHISWHSALGADLPASPPLPLAPPPPASAINDAAAGPSARSPIGTTDLPGANLVAPPAPPLLAPITSRTQAGAPRTDTRSSVRPPPRDGVPTPRAPTKPTGVPIRPAR